MRLGGAVLVVTVVTTGCYEWSSPTAPPGEQYETVETVTSWTVIDGTITKDGEPVLPGDALIVLHLFGPMTGRAAFVGSTETIQGGAYQLRHRRDQPRYGPPTTCPAWQVRVTLRGADGEPTDHSPYIPWGGDCTGYETGGEFRSVVNYDFP